MTRYEKELVEKLGTAGTDERYLGEENNRRLTAIFRKTETPEQRRLVDWDREGYISFDPYVYEGRISVIVNMVEDWDFDRFAEEFQKAMTEMV